MRLAWRWINAAGVATGGLGATFGAAAMASMASTGAFVGGIDGGIDGCKRTLALA